MKLLTILALSLLLMSNIAKAQELQPNTHITNIYIDKFQGIWRWISGTDTIILRLGKAEVSFHPRPENSSADILLGCHQYIQNGTVVESSLERYDSVILYNHKRNTFYGWNNTDYMDTSKVTGVFKDISKSKIGDIFLEYINGTTPQLIWRLENTKGLKTSLPGQPPFDFSFTLPRNIILTKVP